MGALTSVSMASGCLVMQTAVLMTAPASSWAAGIRPGCQWDQYYDENVDSCGPCSEICDHMSLTSTERQCKEQCYAYLIQKSCTVDEYFEESGTECLPCAALCEKGENMKNGTGASQQCHDKCPQFLKKQLQPAMGDGGKHSLNTTRDQSSSLSSVWAPGIVAFAVFGALFVTVIGGFVVRSRRYRGTPRQTTPPADVPGDRVPVQVSGENIDISLQEGNADAEAPEYHMAETDPRAPSSSAAEMVQLMPSYF